MPTVLPHADGSRLGRASGALHAAAGALPLPALCTNCDLRLDDAAIRACPVRDCPHAQREAA